MKQVCLKCLKHFPPFFQRLEEYKRKYSEVSELLVKRNRQYQKLQGLFETMRLRTVEASEKEGLNLAANIFPTGEW